MPRGLRNTLIVFGVFAALLGIATGVFFAILATSFSEVQRVSIEQDSNLKRPAPAPTTKPAPINILLLGSDNRARTNSAVSADQLTGFRSDTIMVAQISADRQDVAVMSIMRDNWVDIQGVGQAKINAAFSYGGLPLAVNTIENFIGARIDHVAVVDFESFKGLTNAVGGVTVNNSLAYSAGGYTFNQGEIELDGNEALAYVRERYSFQDGDYQRVRNQQAFVRGLIGKLISRETLTDPLRIIDTYNAVKPYLILDSGMDLIRATRLGNELRSIRPENIVFFTSPTLGTATSIDGQSIVVVDEAAMAPIRQAFADGTVYDWAVANGN